MTGLPICALIDFEGFGRFFITLRLSRRLEESGHGQEGSRREKLLRLGLRQETLSNPAPPDAPQDNLCSRGLEDLVGKAP